MESMSEQVVIFLPPAKLDEVSFLQEKEILYFLQSSSSELCCSHKLSRIILFWAKTKQKISAKKVKVFPFSCLKLVSE